MLPGTNKGRYLSTTPSPSIAAGCKHTSSSGSHRRGTSPSMNPDGVRLTSKMGHGTQLEMGAASVTRTTFEKCMLQLDLEVQIGRVGNHIQNTVELGGITLGRGDHRDEAESRLTGSALAMSWREKSPISTQSIERSDFSMD